ncbi:hypothetical protein PCASD_15588 [Puccinia coronata f. sp. avenae]|uniref:Uncharacterized protein n=1 Tax=Puccinia coronata f. sp. avenae TaxID=200324 RepID=A0A2N5TW90_9BASI|nr:hypothetical protein PCASD_15588 [Puccinia coronata f. sp. avenae]
MAGEGDVEPEELISFFFLSKDWQSDRNFIFQTNEDRAFSLHFLCKTSSLIKMTKAGKWPIEYQAFFSSVPTAPFNANKTCKR